MREWINKITESSEIRDYPTLERNSVAAIRVYILEIVQYTKWRNEIRYNNPGWKADISHLSARGKAVARKMADEGIITIEEESGREIGQAYTHFGKPNGTKMRDFSNMHARPGPNFPQN